MIFSSFQYVHGDTVISHKYRFVWVCVPKVASRTMLALFSDHYGGGNPCEGKQIRKLPGWREKAIPNPSDYFRFAFVRNPYERVASVWLDKFRNFNPNSPKLFMRFSELSPATTFSEFVHWLGPDIKQSDDPHWKAQHLFVTDNRGRLAVDFVGKIEQLEQDLDYVRNKLDLPNQKPPKLNSRDSRARHNVPTPYDEFYTPELRDIIRRRYAMDFEMFGYSPDSYLHSRAPTADQPGDVSAIPGDERQAVPRS